MRGKGESKNEPVVVNWNRRYWHAFSTDLYRCRNGDGSSSVHGGFRSNSSPIAIKA